MERMKRWIPLLAACAAMVVLVFCPDAAADAAREGLRVCAEVLIPSLLPFFVVSGLLRAWGLPELLGRLVSPVTGRIWGVGGGCATAFLLGILGGYPLGAAAIGKLRADGAISKDEGERALAFCSSTGPAFLMGAAGMGVFHSRAAGLELYGAHVLSAALVGMVFAPKRRALRPERQSSIAAASFSAVLTEAVHQATEALLSVCAFVVLFSVAAGMLTHIGYLPALAGQLSAATGMELTAAQALFTGLLELGSGLGAMQGLGLTPGNLALAEAMISFGGIAVAAQTRAVLGESDLTLRLYLPGKALQAVLAALMILLVNC